MFKTTKRLDKAEERIEDLYKQLYDLQQEVKLRSAGEGQNSLYFMFWNRKRPIGKVVDALLDYLKLDIDIAAEKMTVRKR